MAGKSFFVERYKKLGWEFLEPKIRQAVRANTLKISRENLRKRLATIGVKASSISFAKDGLFIDESEFSVGSAVEYLLGYYYMQDAASQAPAVLLNPKETDIVLDCCASPGGKTTQLSQLMANKGTIIALEKKEERINALKNNLERLGCSNVVAYNMDAADISALKIRFDKILLDAPCSGNFTQEEGWFEKRDLSGIKNNSAKQKRLLAACYGVLKTNGVLVYSTCSLEPEEDEENVAWFEKNFGVKLIMQKRFWPSNDCQGFFAAKFVKLR